MRRSLRLNHCHTGADWSCWLDTLGRVCQRLQRIAKHHRKLWETSRRDFEVAKATQEGRAGKLRRAMSLIFPTSTLGVADNAFWRKATVTGPHGTPEEVWLFETDPAMVSRGGSPSTRPKLVSPAVRLATGVTRGDLPRRLCM